MGGLKAGLQSLLREAGIYQRLKASCVYDLYWSMADPTIIRNREGEVRFYRAVLRGLPERALVFDVGANHGYKADIFSRLGATVVAVDPDENNQAILRQKFVEYRVRKKPVHIVGKAVDSRVGVDTLWVDTPGSAKNTLSKKWVEILRHDGVRFGQALEFGEAKTVQTTTLEDLIKTYGRPFFVKIDVEGYEANVLRGLSQPIPYLSFEVNLPEFREEGRECIDLLHQLDAQGMFNYVVDCQAGLVLEQWRSAKDFALMFGACADKSIEIFWRTVATN